MKTLLRLVIPAFLFVLIHSCKNNHSSSEKLERCEPILNKATKYFEKKPDQYFYTYDKFRGEIENFDKGFIDTFSVNDIKFQLFSNPDSTGDLELQVLKNGKWQTNLKLPYGINGSKANKDVNRDGFNDFVLSLRRGNEVYLYDTLVNEYHKEPIALAFEWCIIDSSKSIYSNNYSNGDFWNTDLFLLKGFQQTFLYDADINFHIDSMSEIGYLQVFKVTKNDLAKTTLICNNKINFLHEDFDYCKFWKKFLRKKRCS